MYDPVTAMLNARLLVSNTVFALISMPLPVPMALPPLRLHTSTCGENAHASFDPDPLPASIARLPSTLPPSPVAPFIAGRNEHAHNSASTPARYAPMMRR